MLKRLVPVAAILLASVAPALGGFWDGAWVLRPIDDGERDILVVEVYGSTVSWWIPDEATMHQGNGVEMTEETLSFDVGALFNGVRISLRATGANSAEGQSRTRDKGVPDTGTAGLDGGVPIRATR